MREAYNDIRRRIKDPVLWFDENGVPRYDRFSPTLSPNIYAQQVALLLIACQACGDKFLVEMNADMRNPHLGMQVLDKSLHYGDPPIHGCTGDTMNSIPIRVVRFWDRETMSLWERRKEFEVEITPDWASEVNELICMEEGDGDTSVPEAVLCDDPDHDGSGEAADQGPVQVGSEQGDRGPAVQLRDSPDSDLESDGGLVRGDLAHSRRRHHWERSEAQLHSGTETGRES